MEDVSLPSKFPPLRTQTELSDRYTVAVWWALSIGPVLVFGGYHIERLIESGDIKNYSDAAKKIGVTRTRMTQIRNLLNLSPRIQEAILLGKITHSERQLRGITEVPDWERQGI